MTFFDNFDVEKEAERVHEANKKWWVDIETGEPIERNRGEQMMLVVSELAEAMEGVRKGLADAHCEGFSSEEVEIADALIRCLDYLAGHKMKFQYEFALVTTPVPEEAKPGAALLTIVRDCTEVANWWYMHPDGPELQAAQISVVIGRLVEYAAWRNLRLIEAYEAKMAYNAIREDHKLENRKAAGGKKW